MKKLFLLAQIFISPICMAEMVTLSQPMYIPSPFWESSEQAGSNAYSVVTIDADFEKSAAIVQYTSTQPISKLLFSTQVITTTGVLDWRIETVGNGSDGLLRGVPTDTLYCTNSSGTITIDALQDATQVITDAITADCTPTFGDFIGIVLTRPSGGAFNGTISNRFGNNLKDFALSASSTSAAGWAKLAVGPNILIQVKDGSFLLPPGATPFAVNNASNTTVTMRYMGNQFTFPFKIRLTGVKALIDIDNPVRFDVFSGATNLTGITLSSGTRGGNNNTALIAAFEKSVIIDANTPFRIVASTTAGLTSNFIIFETTTSAFASGSYAAWPYGSNIVATGGKPTISSASDFWNSTGKRFLIFPMIDQIELNSNITNIYNSSFR